LEISNDKMVSEDIQTKQTASKSLNFGLSFEAENNLCSTTFLTPRKRLKIN